MTATTAERHAGHNWPTENCPACIGERDERPAYRRGDGLTALIALQSADGTSACGSAASRSPTAAGASTGSAAGRAYAARHTGRTRVSGKNVSERG
jgi:hypothetical protein